jgi:hypothetical protein
MVSGGEVNDYEVEKLAIYYKLAKAFGWSKGEIDKLDMVELQNMIVLIDEINKKRAEAGDLSLMNE